MTAEKPKPIAPRGVRLAKTIGFASSRLGGPDRECFREVRLEAPNGAAIDVMQFVRHNRNKQYEHTVFCPSAGRLHRRSEIRRA